MISSLGKLINGSNKFQIVIITLSLASLFLYLNTITHSYLKIINSDWLMVYQIFDDIFKDKIGLAGWMLTSAPYIFPDYLGIWLLYGITNSISASTYIYQGIFILVFVWISYKLFNQIITNKWLAWIYGLASAIAVLYIVPFNDYSFFSLILLHQSHIAPAVFGIFLLSAYLEYERRDSNNIYFLIGLYLILLLISFSDQLTIVQATIPLILTIGMQILTGRGERKKQINFIIGISVATILSKTLPLILEKILSISFLGVPTPCHNLQAVLNYCSRHAVPEIMGLISRNPILVCIYLVCNIFSLIFLIRIDQSFDYKNASKNGEINNNKIKIRFCLIFFFIAQVVNLLSVILYCRLTDSGTFRYLLILFIFPIFSTFLILAQLSIDKANEKLGSAIPLISLLLCLTYYPINVGKENLQFLPNLTEPYPVSARSLDKIASTYQLKTGIANYWHAKLLEMLTKPKIRLNHIQENDLSFWRIHNNKNRWFIDPETGQKPEYNFIVMNSLSPQKVEQEIAKPDLKIKLDSLEVWLYTKHEKELNDFLDKQAEKVKSVY
jgi:hypothetical protein